MYTCKYCGKSFERKQQLAGHIIWCKNNPNRSGKSNFNKKYKNGIRPQDELKDLYCQFCGKHCKNLNSLRQHEVRCKKNPNKIDTSYVSNIWKAYNLDIKLGKRTKTYANQYTKPFNEISGVMTELQNALACGGRVFALIDEPAESPDPIPDAVPEHVDGNVELKNVSFSYRPDQKLIEDLSLAVSAGQRIAIVGPTGCGKTTVINLLRFYDPNSGEICIEGVNVKAMSRHELRKNYGMVLQEIWLKSGTIRDNIVMGRPDATDDEVIAAAKASHAHSFIMRLPEGYQTKIGEDGGSLSQGQKQLLCVTRVMLCLPPMLILDEATSSIDTRTEHRIQKAFNRMMQGRTSFIVAHRLSTIREADRILVMKSGQVVEQGTHEDLLAKNGFYAELCHSQFAY